MVGAEDFALQASYTEALHQIPRLEAHVADLNA